MVQLPRLLDDPSVVVAFALLETVIFLIAVRFADLYEREPIGIVGAMALWGATGAVVLSLAGNRFVSERLSPQIEEALGAALRSAIVEETAKGAALLLVLLASWFIARRFGWVDFEGVTDGIVYGASVGLGFAFTENLGYLMRGVGLTEFMERAGGLFVLQNLEHAAYSAAFGAGLGLATWTHRRWLRWLAPVGGLLLAMCMHALNNGSWQMLLVLRHGVASTFYVIGCVQDQLDVVTGLDASCFPDEAMLSTAKTGLTVTVLSYWFLISLLILSVYLWLRYQRSVIGEELAGEVDDGVLSDEELKVVSQYFWREVIYFRLLRERRIEDWRRLRRRHLDLVELAFLKRRCQVGGVDPSEFNELKRLLIREH